jgi:MFS family permease
MKMDAVTLGWITTSFLLTTAIFLIPLGKISDIAGRKKIFSGGIVLYILFSFLSAVSFSGGMLIFSRVLQGIGAAMVFSTSNAILAAAFSPWYDSYYSQITNFVFYMA